MTDAVRSPSRVEQRLSRAGHHLPQVEPKGRYALATCWNQTVMTSGQLSRAENGVLAGTASGTADLPALRRACEVATLRAIAATASVVHLDAIKRLVFLRGFIASTPGFQSHSAGLDAASDLLALAFGPSVGLPSRSAIGVASLPSGGLVEIELVLGV